MPRRLAERREIVADPALDEHLMKKLEKLNWRCTERSTCIKGAAKEIVGTCLPLGVKIDGKNPKEVTSEINSGKWDDKLK